MCLSQGYDIDRYVKRNRRQVLMNLTAFKIEVIKRLLNHEVVVDRIGNDADEIRHRLWQTDERSRGDDSKSVSVVIV